LTVSLRSGGSFAAFHAATTSTSLWSHEPLSSRVPVSKIALPLKRWMNVLGGSAASASKKLFSA